MCMAYLIVLLEQLLRHQWRVMMVFSKCECSLAIVKGHNVSHSRHLESLLREPKLFEVCLEIRERVMNGLRVNLGRR